MHWPQLIYLAFLFIGLGMELVNDGKPKTGKHSFGTAMFGAIIIFGLLYWGGFFR